MLHLRLAALSGAFLVVSLAFSSPAPAPWAHRGKRCTATINSANDVTAANLACTTININSFTMTPGVTLALTGLADGTTINLLGDVTFGAKNWVGPLIKIGTAKSGSTFTFNGNGKTLDGQGGSYWDGKGGGGKPGYMLSINGGGGTFKDVTILNSPTHAIGISSTAPLTITGVNVNNSAGNSLGRNTDCFNIHGSDVTVTGNTCINQDDCVGILAGSNINFSNNICSGGHGISIGSIGSGYSVSDVMISGNTVTSSANGLRIKTVYGATSASVTNIVYSGNTAEDISGYGVIIEQDYENGSPSGTPSNGVTLGPITFRDNNTVSVNSKAKQVYVLCGTKCTGTWDWSGLTTSGGSSGSSNFADIIGYTV